jgi:hypothetical protein
MNGLNDDLQLAHPQENALRERISEPWPEFWQWRLELAVRSQPPRGFGSAPFPKVELERLALFQDRLPELLERGLQDVLDQPDQDNPDQEAELDQSQQHTELFRILRQIRADVQAKHGTYQGDL